MCKITATYSGLLGLTRVHKQLQYLNVKLQVTLVVIKMLKMIASVTYLLLRTLRLSLCAQYAMKNSNLVLSWTTTLKVFMAILLQDMARYLKMKRWRMCIF
jgi:hypothetical protein